MQAKTKGSQMQAKKGRFAVAGLLHKGNRQESRAKGSTVASRAPSMLFCISGWSRDDAMGRLSSATADGAGLGLWP